LLVMCSSFVVGRYLTSICALREGCRRISFGRFPIVMYIGYAAFFRNIVTLVLSDESRMGIIVVPGFFVFEMFLYIRLN
jgi:hypothetical protein